MRKTVTLPILFTFVFSMPAMASRPIEGDPAMRSSPLPQEAVLAPTGKKGKAARQQQQQQVQQQDRIEAEKAEIQRLLDEKAKLEKDRAETINNIKDLKEEAEKGLRVLEGIKEQKDLSEKEVLASQQHKARLEAEAENLRKMSQDEQRRLEDIKAKKQELDQDIKQHVQVLRAEPGAADGFELLSNDSAGSSLNNSVAEDAPANNNNSNNEPVGGPVNNNSNNDKPEEKSKDKVALVETPESLAQMQSALASSAANSEEQGWFSWGRNCVNNELTRFWTSEADRYAPGTYPPLTYASVLTALKTIWFKGRSDDDIKKLTRDAFRYCLQPLHFTSPKHKGGYFFPVAVDCGRLTIEISDPSMRNLLITAGDATIEQKNRTVYNSYISSLRVSRTKKDMLAYNPIYDNQDDSLHPYDFFLYMRQFLEGGENQSFYRDIQFCMRPDHYKHDYTMLTLRLVVFDTNKGYPIYFSFKGYRVDHAVDESDVSFYAKLKKWENIDWLVKRSK